MSQEEIQPKKKTPEELTETELEQMEEEIKAVIEGLEGIDPTEFTPAQAQDHQETLQSTYELGGVLAMEQVRRLMEQLKQKVAVLKEKSGGQTAQVEEEAAQ